MGFIDLDSSGRFRVMEATSEDLAALRAGLRASQGSDPMTADLVFDSENPYNVAALWCADIAWREAALRHAFALVLPLAIQQISTFNPLRSQHLRKFFEGRKPSVRT